MPLHFEPNLGQTHEDVAYSARASGYTFFLTHADAVFVIPEPGNDVGHDALTPEGILEASPPVARVVRMRFVDANPAPRITGEQPLAGKSNYFVGDDSAGWLTGVPHYARVVVHDLWPGVDAVFSGTPENTVQYDFVARPGADPDRVRVAFDGALPTADSAPAELASGSDLLAYSTYLGASELDSGLAVAVDDAGHAYMTGITQSTDFPTANAYQSSPAGGGDVFVTKLGPDGDALVTSTYLGGAGEDWGQGLAVDADGHAYVVGWTDAVNFPTVNALMPVHPSPGIFAGFVSKFEPSGAALAYSTFLGGSNADSGLAVAVDEVGDAHVAGLTLSSDFPTRNAYQPNHAGGSDAFVTKLRAPVTAYPRPGHTDRVSVASDGAQAAGQAWAPALSADGRYVAFHSWAPNLVPDDTNATTDVFVHDRQTGVTERVSVASDGTEGNAPSFNPAVSADGRYVAFESTASNLVAGDTNDLSDVFVHDRQTGETYRVSVASDGAQGNSWSTLPSLSADGRYVAFDSHASNLAPGDTNGAWDVFVHDLQTGVTERVSVASDGTEGNADSVTPSISADGRLVAFTSAASNLIPDDTNQAIDVFVHDRASRVTERVSVASDGSEGNGGSFRPSISADGRYVAFVSESPNLGLKDTNARWDIFVHDRQTGVLERVSVSSEGVEGNGESFWPSLSADGRYVAFQSQADNLVPDDTNAQQNVFMGQDVFVHDRLTGATDRVSVASDGTEGNNASFMPAISADGRYVAFDSLASTLVADDTNGHWDVFVRDRGPAVGVGELSAARDGDGVAVSGWTGLSGQVLASATDLEGDGELTGASLVYRHEQADLLARLQVDSLFGERCTILFCEDGGGAAGIFAPGLLHRRVTYGIGFELEGVSYEIRARTGSSFQSFAHSESDDPHFALYRCDPDCTEQTVLAGVMGSTGPEIRVAVPLPALGASEGMALTQMRAFATREEGTLADEETLDDVSLGDAIIPAARVWLGIAPAGTPEADVAFDAEATLADGIFSGTVDGLSSPAGEYEAWARACLGEVCGAEKVGVVL